MDFPRQLVTELVHQEIDQRSHADWNGFRILEEGEEAHVLGAPARKNFDQAAFDEVVLAQEGREVGDAQSGGHGMVKQGKVVADELWAELDGDGIISAMKG